MYIKFISVYRSHLFHRKMLWNENNISNAKTVFVYACTSPKSKKGKEKKKFSACETHTYQTLTKQSALTIQNWRIIKQC